MNRALALFCLCPLLAASSAAQTPYWIPNEGGPWGGNITNILPLPDRTIASGQGTIYQAAIPPATWAPQRMGLPANQLVFDPGRDNTGTFYAAIDGVGILRSATGAMWGTFNSGLVNLNVKTLTARDSILLAGSGSGLFEASPGAAQWTSFGFNGNLVVKVDFRSGGPVYAGLPTSGMHRYSGGTWTPINNGLNSFNWTSLGVSPVGNDVAVSTDEELYLSTNGGDSWNSLLTGSGYSAVRFSNLGVLHVGAGPVIKRTTNQGGSFADLPDLGPGRVNSMAFDNANTLWVAHSIRGAVTYAGTDWQERNDGITSFTVQSIAGVDAALVATSQGGYVRIDDRGTASYRRVIPTATPAGRSFQSAYIESPRATNPTSGPSSMYFGTQDGLLRSGDGGITWSPANTGLTNTIIWDIVGKDSLLFVATYNGIHRSTNGGDTWVQANNGNTTLTSGLVLQRSTGHLFALASGASRSTDDGANWTTVYIPPGFAATTGMDFAPNGNMYVGVLNNGVARSTDDGTTWEILRNGLDDWAVRDVAVDAQGVVYAGTALGVFRSTNGGDTWSAITSGLDATVVTDLHVDSHGYLFAGTMAGGVYRSAVATSANGTGHGLPAALRLAQNYPNPFNPSTTIEYDLPSSGWVSLKVFDLLGREVSSLRDAQEDAGVHRVTFHAAGLPSGVYLHRLKFSSAGGNTSTQTRSMVLLK